MRFPAYMPTLDRSGAGDIERYVKARFAEHTFSKPVLDIRVDTFPEAYHAIVRVATAREELPYAMLDLAADIEEKLEEQGYPVLVILRPTPNSL
jgi:hypothetical protein